MWSNPCVGGKREIHINRLGTRCRMSVKGFALEEVSKRIEFAIFHSKTHTHTQQIGKIN